jgi:hypothetical protein
MAPSPTSTTVRINPARPMVTPPVVVSDTFSIGRPLLQLDPRHLLL